jgi:anti-anti-sigma factor
VKRRAKSARLRSPQDKRNDTGKKNKKKMILEFTKRTVQPGVTAFGMKGSIHCGPECARLEREVDAMIAARETRVIFDMSGVTHADSAAIGSIVRCFGKLKSAGGGMRIAAPQSMVDHSLKLTKVDRVIEIFPSVEQAAQGFSGPEAAAGQRVPA